MVFHHGAWIHITCWAKLNIAKHEVEPITAHQNCQPLLNTVLTIKEKMQIYLWQIKSLVNPAQCCSKAVNCMIATPQSCKLNVVSALLEILGTECSDPTTELWSFPGERPRVTGPHMIGIVYICPVHYREHPGHSGKQQWCIFCERFQEK